MSKENSDATLKALSAKLDELRGILDECVQLIKLPTRKRSAIRAAPHAPIRASVSLDFKINPKAFAKKYCRKLSGPKKFVLLVAYLSAGDANKEVSVRDVEKLWNRMTDKSLLGAQFNGAFANRAAANNWIHPIRYAFYKLQPSWKEVLEQ